jgi:quercetin dioxygenase-like cupin family protein
MNRFLHAVCAAAVLTLAAACNQPAEIVDANPVSTTPLARSAQDAALAWSPCADYFPAGCELVVLHGDARLPNADVFFRVPGGYAIPAHTHDSAERMVLVSDQLTTKYQGAPESTLAVGDYAYGPAGLPHRATCISEEPCTLFIAFEGPVNVEAFEGALD